MKYIYPVLKKVTEITSMLTLVSLGVMSIALSLNKNPWLIFPSILLWAVFCRLWFGISNKCFSKKCPYCKGKGRETGQSGSEYKQWLCDSCGKMFWTTLFLEKYENEQNQTT